MQKTKLWTCISKGKNCWHFLWSFLLSMQSRALQSNFWVTSGKTPKGFFAFVHILLSKLSLFEPCATTTNSRPTTRYQTQNFFFLTMNSKIVILELENCQRSNTHCLKITLNVAFTFINFDFSNNFCPITIDLSGNPVWQQD